MATILGSIAAVLVGGVVATVTVVGIVSGSVNSSSSTPGDVADPVITYGATQ